MTINLSHLLIENWFFVWCIFWSLVSVYLVVDVLARNYVEKEGIRNDDRFMIVACLIFGGAVGPFLLLMLLALEWDRSQMRKDFTAWRAERKSKRRKWKGPLTKLVEYHYKRKYKDETNDC